ncbi:MULTISPECIES: hypothetical protein [Gordonia]|uniref:Head-to-tail adaptor n=1 Tax=Gordonia alkanivorans CGMCC 6845 TaxID=1423140 RepID=W9DC13_9ACTN|nr:MULTISPECIES: hypothetical protein [Gordonia]ETA06978.1 hypothetical protein V525_09960 [Gordonia alkanivorans CGMCC 6845]MDH3021664.1 hypothetical protein [Gordonia alkanivorans]MDH3027079.1 hypothetical protein [Gordonia alkanivorans]MDH3050732.1 hypothetical protein [Gordonia alkanivorans]MDJ0007457.1 hypothetical protein [Gordonia alkanivorans]
MPLVLELTPADLAPFATIPEAKAAQMITDALAIARTIAPCIADDEFEHADAAKAIIRGAILRWDATGAAALTTQSTAGPISETVTVGARRSMFFPSEITGLQKLCGQQRRGRAYTIDTTPPPTTSVPVRVLNLPGQ